VDTDNRQKSELVAALVDTSWGKSSSFSNGSSIKCSVSDHTLKVTYTIIFNCGTDRELILTRKKEEEEARTAMGKYIARVKSDFKSEYDKSLSLKSLGPGTTHMDIIDASKFNLKRTALMRYYECFEIKELCLNHRGFKRS
jgi:hypothetical protein